MHVICSLLHVVRCMLSVACCPLHAACCLAPAGAFELAARANRSLDHPLDPTPTARLRMDGAAASRARKDTGGGDADVGGPTPHGTGPLSWRELLHVCLGAAATSDEALRHSVPLTAALQRTAPRTAEAEAEAGLGLAAEFAERLERFAAWPLRDCLRETCAKPQGVAAALEDLSMPKVDADALAPRVRRRAALDEALLALCSRAVEADGSAGADGSGLDGSGHAARTWAAGYARSVAMVRQAGGRAAAAWAAVRASLEAARHAKRSALRSRRNAGLRAHATARAMGLKVLMED